MSHQIKVTDELFEQLRGRAAGRPIPQLIRELLGTPILEGSESVGGEVGGEVGGDDCLENMSEEDRAILEGLTPGELPSCCREIFNDPECPVPTCSHWRKAYENYYGQRMWGYVNDLVGGGYRTWLSKYVK